MLCIFCFHVDIITIENTYRPKFLYPYGATLNVAKPSTVAVSSGTITVPTNRPICAYYSSKSSGKLIVLGSSKLLSDAYIDKENNDAFREMIFEFFDSEPVDTSDLQGDDGDVITKKIICDT